MKKELEKINSRLEAIEENTDIDGLSFGQFALACATVLVGFIVALIFIMN